MKNILRTKAMLNFALFSFPKGGKHVCSIYLALKAQILIRNDSLIFEESKAKTVCEYIICRTSYECLKLWS